MKKSKSASRRFGTLCTALIASALLSACGKNAPPAAPEPAAAPASTVSAAPAITLSPASNSTSAPAIAVSAASGPSSVAPSPPFVITKLTLGSEVNAEHQVTRADDSFPNNDKAIYASVATEGNTGGATLNAKWSYLEGQGQLVSSISQSIATDGPAITTFKVQNPDLWPAGKYQVEISLDGKPVMKQAFQIAKN